MGDNQQTNTSTQQNHVSREKPKRSCRIGQAHNPWNANRESGDVDQRAQEQAQASDGDLQDEISHLEDYVSLEKMRFHDTLEVTIDKSIEDSTIQVAPMLLIPFVENSFKHGAIIEGKQSVNITIHVKEEILHFEVVNSSVKEEETTKGIGLENSRKRLEILYPSKHKLIIEEQKNQFKVVLKINDLKQLQYATTN